MHDPVYNQVLYYYCIIVPGTVLYSRHARAKTWKSTGNKGSRSIKMHANGPQSFSKTQNISKQLACSEYFLVRIFFFGATSHLFFFHKRKAPLPLQTTLDRTKKIITECRHNSLLTWRSADLLSSKSPSTARRPCPAMQLVHFLEWKRTEFSK